MVPVSRSHPHPRDSCNQIKRDIERDREKEKEKERERENETETR